MFPSVERRTMRYGKWNIDTSSTYAQCVAKSVSTPYRYRIIQCTYMYNQQNIFLDNVSSYMDFLLQDREQSAVTEHQTIQYAYISVQFCSIYWECAQEPFHMFDTWFFLNIGFQIFCPLANTQRCSLVPTLQSKNLLPFFHAFLTDSFL